MSILNLEETERDLLKASITLRLKSCANSEFYKQIVTDLEEILKRIDSSLIDLKPPQKATLIGCIKELVIYPNEELLRISDFEVFMCSNADKEKLKYIEIGVVLIQKLKRQKDLEFRNLGNTFRKIDSLLKMSKVYYSETDDGNIYKVGIITEGNKGIEIVMSGTSFLNFDISKISKDNYEKSAKPNEVLQKMVRYAQKNPLTKNQEKLMNILEKSMLPLGCIKE